MYAGDFGLEIYHGTTSEGSFIDRCSAFCAKLHLLHRGPVPERWTRQSLENAGWLEPESDVQEDEWAEDEEAEEAFDWTGQKIGMALWNLGHFERLCWDWKHANDRGGVPTSDEDKETAAFMGTSDGGSFMARIFANLAWNHGPSAIAAIGEKAHAELSKLPDPAQGVSRERFAAFMDEDLALLFALCEKDGTLAGGWLKDPQAKIKHALIGRSNGNEVRVCLETSDEWFGVDFVTS